MTHKAYILTLILVASQLVTFGQIGIEVKKYEYELCIYHRAKEQPKIIKNEIIGIGDTTVAFISGTIWDYKGEPISFAVLNLLSLNGSSKFGAIADSLGNFKLHLPAGNYKLTALSIGYSSLITDDFLIGTGELRELKLQLGNAQSYKIYNIVSDKPLSKRKLNRIEKRLRKK